MLKTTGSSVASASKVDGDKVVGDRGAVGEGAVGRSDVSRKSAKSKSRTKSGYLGNSDNMEKPKFLSSNEGRC